MRFLGQFITLETAVKPDIPPDKILRFLDFYQRKTPYALVKIRFYVIFL